jgi:beta-glucanase (GH16 family)
MNKTLYSLWTLMLGAVLVCQAQMVDPESPIEVKPDVNFSALPVDSQASNWELVFSDEFNDTEIDANKWNIQDDFARLRNNDIWLYARTEDVEERNGNAYIYYAKDQEEDKKYYAGRFESKYKYARTFGFFEARIHIVEPFGHQTAFWMMPNQEGTTAPNGVIDGTAKDGAEIDIIEGNYNSDKYSTGLHWDGYGADHKGKGFKPNAPDLYSEEYHTFGFEWSPTFLKWYYDGEVVRTETDPKYIALVDHHLYFSGSVFGASSDWVSKYIGDYDLLNNGGRDEAYIDWVRVYANKTLKVSLADDAIIMDSEDNEGIIITGDWAESTQSEDYYGENYLHDNKSDNLQSVSYSPELGTIGDFEIFTRFPVSEEGSTQTKYEIITKVNGEQVIETVLVDQTKNSGDWISIGTYTLSGVAGPKVIISNENANGYVIADAIAFERKGLPEGSIVMDNSDVNGVVVTGNWIASSNIEGFYGVNYLYGQSNGGEKSVSFSPELSTLGDFEIFTRFPASSNRSTQTKYEIITKVNGEQVIETVLVDQTTNSGEWISLGIYTLSGVTFPKVIISNDNANGYVVVDAVAFARQGIPTLDIKNPLELEKSINAYTVNDELIVLFSKDNSEPADIVIYNIYGVPVKTYTNINLTQQNYRLNLGANNYLGFYIIRVNIGGHSITKKIIW